MAINIDNDPYPLSTPHSSLEHLLCPPKALVECMFPDAFVFPASLFEAGRSRPSVPSPTTFSKLTVEVLFEALCKQGLYSRDERRWATLSNSPDFHNEHLKNTELLSTTFLEHIVDTTVQLIDAQHEEVRMWSARDDPVSMRGSFQRRKPDIFVKRKDVPADWRTVDCVVEMNNGAADGDRDFLGQIAEHARTLFNVQDTRRFALLIRIKKDQFSYTVYDRGGSITTPFVGINSHALLFYRLILSISFAERRHLGYDTSITGLGAYRRLKLDLACERSTAAEPTVRLLKVDSEKLADFYGDKNGQYMSLPGVKPGQKDFGIVSKDSWEEVDEDSGGLSEGLILQLLHAKGVPGVSWCLDEKPVVVPDAPPSPMPVAFQPAFLDNTLYIRSRLGIRALQVAEYASNALFKKEDEELKMRVVDAMVAQTFAQRTKETFRHLLPKSKPKPAKRKKTAVDKGKGKGKEKEKGKGKEKEKEKEEDSLSSATGPGQTSSQPEAFHMPRILIDDEEDIGKDRHFTMRCHIRSYLYPVGTPIYWFRSLLELLCVMRDLLETHKQACSVQRDSGKGFYAILHRDMSLWNFLKVSQERSDWPKDRKWSSPELQKLWEELPDYVRKPIHRGLLIDWGFAAFERLGDVQPAVDLTAEDVKVYEPVEWSPPPGLNAVDGEEHTIRHCHSPTTLPDGARIYPIPPLWNLRDDGRLGGMNTQTFVHAAKHGEINLRWVNAALRKDGGQLSNPTGTWPFVCLDVKVAWLMNRQLAIQYWHDLETLFVSFTALCVWFNAPFYAKDITDNQTELAWIFEPHDPQDSRAAHRTWEMFRTHFDDKILGNLSSYFDCDAIRGLLVAMRDMCIPPEWAVGDLTPTGYIPLEDGSRATHDQMIDAVETAIQMLLTDTDSTRRDLQVEPQEWGEAHASIDEDGVFIAPPNMTKDLPPVVLDGMGNEKPRSDIGVFHRVRAITLAPGFFSNRHPARDMITSTTPDKAATSYRRWAEQFEAKLKKHRHVPDEAAVDFAGAFSLDAPAKK